MITTRSHFTGLIEIAASQDSTAPNAAKTGNATKLENFMEAYERDCLIKCFGYSLYKEFWDTLEIASGKTYHTVKSDAADKWKKLYAGHEYDLDGRKVKWDGINYTLSVVPDAEPNRSLLADYIYCFFMSDDVVTHTTTGMKTAAAKNANNASSSPSIIRAWRSFYKKTIGAANTKTIIHSDHGIGIDYRGNGNSIRSLFQYIEDMNILTPGHFENWEPDLIKNKNQFSV